AIAVAFAAMELLIDHRRDRRSHRTVGGLRDDLSADRAKGLPLGFVAELVKLGINTGARIDDLTGLVVPGDGVALAQNIVAGIALSHGSRPSCLFRSTTGLPVQRAPTR